MKVFVLLCEIQLIRVYRSHGQAAAACRSMGEEHNWHVLAADLALSERPASAMRWDRFLNQANHQGCCARSRMSGYRSGGGQLRHNIIILWRLNKQVMWYREHCSIAWSRRRGGGWAPTRSMAPSSHGSSAAPSLFVTWTREWRAPKGFPLAGPGGSRLLHRINPSPGPQLHVFSCTRVLSVLGCCSTVALVKVVVLTRLQCPTRSVDCWKCPLFFFFFLR
jgi:hypothetical protein